MITKEQAVTMGLRVQKIAFTGTFSPEVSSEVLETIFSDMITTRLSMRLPLREISKTRWPASWREALKERFAPAWLLRRWPVIYKGIDVVEVFDFGPLPPGSRDRIGVAYMIRNADGGILPLRRVELSGPPKVPVELLQRVRGRYTDHRIYDELGHRYILISDIIDELLWLREVAG